MMVREVARYVPPGPDHFWRLDEALGELVAREIGTGERLPFTKRPTRPSRALAQA